VSRAAGPLVFITGASSGIGQALAARFYESGWRLALVARRSDETAAWARSLGKSAAACSAAESATGGGASVWACSSSCADFNQSSAILMGNEFVDEKHFFGHLGIGGVTCDEQ